MIFLLWREVIVGLAILGGLASLLAIVIQAHAAPVWTARINRLAYVFMGISMLLFIIKGLAHFQGA